MLNNYFCNKKSNHPHDSTFYKIFHKNPRKFSLPNMSKKSFPRVFPSETFPIYSITFS